MSTKRLFRLLCLRCRWHLKYEEEISLLHDGRILKAYVKGLFTLDKLLSQVVIHETQLSKRYGNEVWQCPDQWRVHIRTSATTTQFQILYFVFIFFFMLYLLLFIGLQIQKPLAYEEKTGITMNILDFHGTVFVPSNTVLSPHLSESLREFKQHSDKGDNRSLIGKKVFCFNRLRMKIAKFVSCVTNSLTDWTARAIDGSFCCT